MEQVQCAECSRQYDSDEHPFCPRCGSLGKSDAVATTASTISRRHDPKRRRAQLAGVILAVLGSITGILFLATAILAPSLVPVTLPSFEMQDGGHLTVQVQDETGPLDEVSVVVNNLAGEQLASGFTINGSTTFALPQAGVQVVVSQGGENWTWNVLSLNQTQDHIQLSADLSKPAGDHGWVGADTFVQGSRILAGIFTVISLFTLLGGIQAIRLRNKGIALAGAIVGGLPWFILFMMAPNVAVGLVLLLFVVSAVFIQGGKAHFA